MPASALLRRVAFVLAAVTTALVPIGCSSNSKSGSVAGSATIGSGGGSLRIDAGSLTGLSLEIPAGALTTETLVEALTDSANSQRDYRIVGDAVRFTPSALLLTPAATCTLPFDLGRLPAGTRQGDLRIGTRSQQGGSVSLITPSTVDLQAGTATFSLSGFATFWVVARRVFPIDRYLPLNDGDFYEFENSNRLDVVFTDTDPNFDGQDLWRYSFKLPFFEQTGLYLERDPGSGTILFRGTFNAPFGNPAEQQVLADAVEMLQAEERAGDQRTEDYEYSGYSINLPDPPRLDYEGTGMLQVEIVGEQSLQTPLGRFDPVLQIELRTSYADDRPAMGSGVTRIWLAEDIGPVQIQVGENAPERLVQASVGGSPVVGN